MGHQYSPHTPVESELLGKEKISGGGGRRELKERKRITRKEKEQLE